MTIVLPSPTPPSSPPDRPKRSRHATRAPLSSVFDDMYQFPTPTFGATNGQQGYGSPKPAQTYQPMPAVGTPSFGAFGGRPSTPKETSRHSSYSSKDETTIPLLPPSVERQRRHRDYYFEGGDIYFLVCFRVPSPPLSNSVLIPPSQAENYLFRVHKYAISRFFGDQPKCGGT